MSVDTRVRRRATRISALLLLLVVAVAWHAAEAQSTSLSGTLRSATGQPIAYGYVFILSPDGKAILGRASTAGDQRGPEVGSWAIDRLPNSGKVIVIGFHPSDRTSIAADIATLTSRAQRIVLAIRPMTEVASPEDAGMIGLLLWLGQEANAAISKRNIERLTLRLLPAAPEILWQYSAQGPEGSTFEILRGMAFVKDELLVVGQTMARRRPKPDSGWVGRFSAKGQLISDQILLPIEDNISRIISVTKFGQNRLLLLGMEHSDAGYPDLKDDAQRSNKGRTILLALDYSGKELARRVMDEGSEPVLHAIVALPDGGFAAVGQTRAEFGHGAVWVGRFRPDLQTVWSVTLAERVSHIATDVAFLSSGLLVVSGYSRGGFRDTLPRSGFSPETFTGWVAGISIDGKLRWESPVLPTMGSSDKEFGDTGESQLFALRPSGPTEVIAVGGISYSKGREIAYGVLLAKLNVDGKVVMRRLIRNELGFRATARAVAVLRNRDIVIGGEAVDEDGSYWLFRLRPDGEPIWSLPIGSSFRGKFGRIWKIEAADDGGFAAVGTRDSGGKVGLIWRFAQ